MRKLIVLAAALAGCATQAKFAENMNTLLGAPESAVIARFGAPQSSYSLSDGRKVISYTRSSNMQLGGNTVMQPVTSYGSATAYSNRGGYTTAYGTSTTYVPVQQPAHNISLVCSVQFWISLKGEVEYWHSDGNHCVSQ